MCSAKELLQLRNQLKSSSELHVSGRVDTGPNEELDDVDEGDEDEDDEMPDNMDSVDDLQTRGFIKSSKTITRTTSVVQNFKHSHDSVDYNNSFDHSKSMTHIEKERENALQLSRLKRARRMGFKRDSSS